VLLLLSTSRFVLAAKGASIPRTVPHADLVTANAISSVAGMSATFLGAVGGATFVGRSSMAGFAAACLLYLGAGATFRRLGDVGGGQRGQVMRRLRQAFIDLRDGLRAVRLPEIGHPLSAVWLHRLLLGAGFVLLVLVADSRFHLRIAGYGLALAVTGLASFAGTVAAPLCARRWAARAVLPVSFLPPAAAAYTAGVAPNLVTLVAGLAVTAFSFQVLKVLVDAMVGGATPDAVRGRVFSLYDVLYNVAFVLAGLLMVPLWHPGQARALLWWLSAAFLGGWALYARLFRVWPFLSGSAVERPRPVWGGRVAALLLGALPVLAFPAVAWWWLAWVGLVPVLLVLRGSATAREAALRGWWAGAGYIAAAGYWLLPVLGPALAMLAFGLGALWLPWGWAVRRLLGGHPGPRTLLSATVVLPSGWVLIEAVRSWQSLGGPWALLGASQWNRPALLASAALGGVWLTGFLVVAVNVAVAGMLTRPGLRAGILLAGVAVIALAVGPVWAALRPSPPVTGVLRVAVVQLRSMGDPDARLDRQIQLSTGLAAERPDLIVWGESSVGFDLPRRPDLVRRLAAVARRTGADLLVNVDARRGAHGRIYKTSVLVTPAGVAGSYVKTRLVPFGEYIPFRRVLGWITAFSKAAPQDRGRGHGPVVLHAGRVALGPLVCFESTFPDLARSEVRLGARMLVYQTADTTFEGTWEQPQHASLAAVRAVETGRPAVQVALTGTTAGYDATGHRLLGLSRGRTATTLRPVPLTAGRTPFDVAGDWVLALAAAVVAAALAAGSLGVDRLGAGTDSAVPSGDRDGPTRGPEAQPAPGEDRRRPGRAGPPETTPAHVPGGDRRRGGRGRGAGGRQAGHRRAGRWTGTDRQHGLQPGRRRGRRGAAVGLRHGRGGHRPHAPAADQAARAADRLREAPRGLRGCGVLPVLRRRALGRGRRPLPVRQLPRPRRDQVLGAGRVPLHGDAVVPRCDVHQQVPGVQRLRDAEQPAAGQLLRSAGQAAPG
jgi:apolipoprotein N-acyltransferase